MKEPFPYDFRAVLNAPGKALSLKKIFVATFFLLLSWLIYLIFTYIALLSDGVSFQYIWKAYGLYPLQWFPFDSTLSMIIYLIGIGLAIILFSLAITGVAVISFEELRGDHFYSAARAIRFSFSRLPTLILAFISILAFLLLIYLLGLIIGLIGRIPLLGEYVLAVFYVIPVYLTLVFAVFIIFALVVAVMLLPTIISAQKRKEVFDSLLQLFSVLIREPLRFFFYLAITVVLAKLASFVYAYLIYRTLQFSKHILVTSGGGKIEKLFISAHNLLPYKSEVVNFFTNIFPGIPFGFEMDRWGYGGTTHLPAIILAAGFFVIFMSVLGYATAIIATGLARGYAVIKRMKDDYFISEEDPLYDSRDFANPPIKESNGN